MSTHSITINGLSEEDLELLVDACKGDLSLYMAECLKPSLEGKEYKIERETSNPVIIDERGRRRKDGGSIVHDVLNWEDVGFKTITYDGRKRSDFRYCWVVNGAVISSSRIQKVDRYEYKKSQKT